MIHVVREFFETNTGFYAYEMIGYDEMKKPMYLYIQRVERWNDPLPSDI
jgi:hypothetical protein